jgi:uncharacterized protein (TIGR03067 family)
MSKFLLFSLAAVTVGAPAPVPRDDGKRDSDNLQGTWQATAGVANGRPVPGEQVQRVKVVFSGDKMSLFPPDGDGKQTLEHTFRVDPSQKPKAIDVTRLEGGGKGKTAQGIYELDGDTLKLCLTSRLEKERPTEFAAPKESGLVLMTLKRVKK